MTKPLTFAQAMFLMFLGLRITGQIDWAWYFIAAPLIVVAIFAVDDERRDRRRRSESLDEPIKGWRADPIDGRSQRR